jgi:membrane associated rhomboid family serine protease
MGLGNRPYLRDEQSAGPGGYGGGGMMRGVMFGMPRPARAVKWLLIVNAVAFVLQLFFDQPGTGPGGVPIGTMSYYFGANLAGWWQPWRYVSFQFLHGGLWHIALNMLGLYMLGTPLERSWGPKRFLRFYLICGVVAGAAYVGMAALTDAIPPWMPIVGASGGVYAVVLAAAVLFPHFRLIFFLFPVPIRFAAVIIFGGMIFVVLSSLSAGEYGPQFWSDVAHLGGAVTAAIWLGLGPAISQARTQARQAMRQGAWDRKMRSEQADREEIDRILEKVRREGIGSLGDKERRKLQEATEKQRKKDRDLRRL